MDEVSSAGRGGLCQLENHYRDELKQAIRKMRDWQNRRVETDVVQLVLDQEGAALREHVIRISHLRREVRRWRVSSI